MSDEPELDVLDRDTVDLSDETKKVMEKLKNLPISTDTQGPKRCDRCEFSTLQNPIMPKSALECRAVPPTAWVAMNPQTGPQVLGRFWPSVKREDWCGKFQLRSSLKNKQN